MPKLCLRSLLAVASLALLSLAVPAVAHAADSGIVPLAPRPHEYVQSSTPAIIVELPAGASADRNAIRFVIDGRDVSDGVSVAHGRATYRPATPLAGGDHAVEVDVDDGSGGRLSYQWTFTVDGNVPSAGSDGAPGNATTENAPLPGYVPSSGYVPLPGYTPSSDYGSSYASAGDGYFPSMSFGPGFGSFYALNAAPFYWGDRIRFVFVGAPGGYGFVTFLGIPGFFNLIPFGFNTYYVIVPIPVGYAIPSPIAVCHFFPVAGTPIVVPYRRHITIVGRRNPATLPVLHPTIATLPVLHPPVATRTTKLPPARRVAYPRVQPRPVRIEPPPARAELAPIRLEPRPVVVEPRPVFAPRIVPEPAPRIAAPMPARAPAALPASRPISRPR